MVEAQRKLQAVIFDMNGVIIDDMPFHREAWQEFASRRGRELSDEEFDVELCGRTNQATLSYLMERPIEGKEYLQLEEEKESIYRTAFLAHRRPLNGLEPLLLELQRNEVGLAVATSAPPDNVSYILDGLSLRGFFSVVIDASQVSHGKPDPELFVRAGEGLGVDPSCCVVVEDSLLGIEAALAAGMKVIGVTTTHPAAELQGASLVVEDLSGLSYDVLQGIADN